MGDEGERHVQSALNEAGGGQCAGCGWIFRSAILDADIVRSLRIQLGPWFVQALTTGDRKGQPSRLDGVRERTEYVLRTKIHGLEEVVIQ